MKSIKNQLTEKSKNRNVTYRWFTFSRLVFVSFIFLFASIGTYLILSSQAAPTINANFNNIGTVDILDLQILATNWASTNATRSTGDANADGKVDILDLSALASQWGQTITPTPTPTPSVSPTPTGQPANSINVKDYGAKGDGTTDDTANLLTAFNAAVAQSKIAWVPSGVYITSSSSILTLPNNVKITGESDASWLKGRFYMSTGNNLSNFSIGVTGYDTRFTQANPVINFVASHITFKGGGGTGQAVLRIDSGEAVSNSSFTDCVIETNPDGIGNGISIVDNGVTNSTLHDVTFTRLHIKQQPRMGFEMLGRSYSGTRTGNYYNIKIIDSIIDAVGAESISFDGPGDHLYVTGTHFLGSNTSDAYSWHQGLEFNGSINAYATGNTFDRQRGWWLNLHCTSCLFENNVFDNTIDTIGQAVSDSVQAWGGVVTNSTFRNNTVKMNAGSGYFYFSGSTGNTFTGNTFIDMRNPYNKASYFVSGSTSNSITGNTFQQYSLQPLFSISSDSSVNISGNTYTRL